MVSYRKSIVLSLLFLILSVTLFGNNVIGPGKGFKISVFNHPELSGEFFVHEDGYLYLPLIDTVYVNGLSFLDARERIINRYRQYLKSPNIIVIPSFRVSVLGEVKKPGIYNISGFESVSDIIALAGGVTDKANPGGVRILRDGRVIAKVNIFRENSEDLKSKGITILPRDIIVVPRKFLPTLQEWSILISTALTVATIVNLIINMRR
ncbi:MAG TPA: polysaccharide export protein [Bacteroidetes bacterium]|nr:polysaccharide export protein [Bacteroidota bacterium]